MLIISSVLSADAEIFTNSLEERLEVSTIKKEYSNWSDHYAILGLYKDWLKVQDNDELFCIHKMVRGNTLRLVKSK